MVLNCLTICPEKNRLCIAPFWSIYVGKDSLEKVCGKLTYKVIVKV